MRRNRLYPLVALSLLGSAALPGRLLAQAADVKPVKPLMMLLLDSSGSMEYKVDPPSGPVDQLPNCTNSASDVYQKTRWAVTTEALAGTISNFRCVRKERATYNDFDKSYHIPHFELSGTQSDDGVLSAFKDRLKFGLMTFDGVLTVVNGRAFEPFSSYQDTNYRSLLTGTNGGFSYPTSGSDDIVTGTSGYGWKQLYWGPTCPSVYGVNAGARGEGTTAINPPGSLIPVGVSDGGSVATNNTNIRTSLLNVRPYGGTPIAAMLDDFRHYMTTSPDFSRTATSSDPTKNDPYRTCRKRYAVLLTDGAPDKLFRNDPQYNCQNYKKLPDGTPCAGMDCCPYDTEEQITTDLLADGLNKLWVVAFNVNDPTGISILNGIANKGGTEKAIPVSNASDLKRELSRVMSESGPDSTSRSVPVIASTGRAVMLGGRQYEISAGFRVGTFNAPWQGYLYRRRITCSGSDPAPQALDGNKGDLFHLTLNDMPDGDRKLYTIAPAVGKVQGSLFATVESPLSGSALYTTDPPRRNLLRPDNTNFTVGAPSDSGTAGQEESATAQLLTNFDGTLSETYFGDANGNTLPAETADRDWIHGYVRGIKPTSSNPWPDRSQKKLADIYHSNPVVLPPVMPGSDELNSFDPQLRAFYADLYTTQSKSWAAGTTSIALRSVPSSYGTAGRPGVIFVGTNDGVLHAFSLDNWPSDTAPTYKAGQELWGFVPPALFGKLATAAAPAHQLMFDGTPVVKDVIYKRELTATGKTAMGTVLIAAVGGAAAYVALDVTYPETPKLLWQRSFKHLGPTVGTPAIGHARIKWNSTDEHLRAVAILPGGEGDETASPSTACPVNVDGRGKAPDGRENVRCWKMRGRVLYVVDIATGELIQEFDGRHFHSPVTGSIALDSDTEPLSQTRAGYFTDADGILWRLWMNNPDPTKWRVQPVWDLFAGTASSAPSSEPSAIDGASSTEVKAAADNLLFSVGRTAETAPLLNRDKQGNLTIVVGTGDIDNLIDTLPNRVVSLQETRVMEGTYELGATTKVVANWKLQLSNGEGVTGPLTVFDDALYFTSFKPPPANHTNLCEIGSTRLWGVHVRSKYKQTPLPEARMTPEGGTGCVPGVSSSCVLYYFPEDAVLKKSLLLGLSITQDNVCVAGTPVSDPLASGMGLRVSGKTGGGQFRMRSMIAGGGTEKTLMQGSNAAGSSGQHQFQRTLPIQNVATSVGWASSIE